MSDNRAFGYIYGSPENGHRFFGIKTEKAAAQVQGAPYGWGVNSKELFWCPAFLFSIFIVVGKNVYILIFGIFENFKGSPP